MTSATSRPLGSRAIADITTISRSAGRAVRLRPYWPTVAQVLAVLEPAVNATFQGYKGGDYRMMRETPVWVANYSHTGGTGIVSIEAEDDHTVILITKKVG
jgi:hypothetical protein